MIESRPEFDKITFFDEFNKYYWYRDELSQICRLLGLEYRGTKQELNDIIDQYFKGNLIKKSSIKSKKKQVEVVTLDTPLLECGSSFNTYFREYFSTLTDVFPFKFTADMATAWRKVKREHDLSFTIQDMLKVYYGNSDYAKYDHSACQWNQFLKDFCADENSRNYSNKLKVASILWKEVRNSSNEKIYSNDLLSEYAGKIKSIVSRNAISLGGASDTLAAITGSIAEAAYGIPDWIKEKAYSYLDKPLKDELRRWDNKIDVK